MIRSQDGYALLILVFFVALLSLSLLAVRPNLITQERREKEQEMIWRGKQYVRAINLYYRKTRRFPIGLDDLYQPKTGIRFLRKPYSDPMNTADGSWRLIYVGPNMQIIGSLNPQPNSLGTIWPGTSQVATAPAPTPNPTGGSLAPPSFASGGPLAPPAAPGTSLANTQATNGSASSSTDTSSSSSQPTIAANAIIGVGSKIDKKSIALFEGAKDYLHFEFIWKIVPEDPTTVVPNP
jgi:hypothetical protein